MTACAKRALVDAHFRGDISLEDERALRAHLDGCTECRGRYERRLVLAAIDPVALPPEARIGRPLGLDPAVIPARRWLLSRIGPALAGLALAAGLALFLRPTPDDGFRARGGATAPASAEAIGVFRLRHDDATAMSAGSDQAIDSDDELAFSYVNPDRARYLMIFGVDERGKVFWFYPGWSDETQTPSAIAIDGGGPHELREAIHHRFGAAKHLEIHGLFLDAPRDVREIERLVAARPSPFGGLELEGSRDHVLGLDVKEVKQ